VSLRSKDPERPPRVGFGIYKRAALGGLLIVLATAAAASSAALLTVEHFVDILKKGEGGQAIKLKKNTLTVAQAGHAQTLLVLGSDHRFHDPKGKKSYSNARSDTIMLVHLDPHAAATTVLSIPRDLEVVIPDHGTDKINAAYSLGGPDLVARTVKKLLGPQVKINHVINVQFGGFQRAVNYLKGVYVDVDQFYFHTNAHLPPSLQYSAIDVKPGYQKLVGSDALAYVRYRHTDSDFIRADRQQDFLRELKDQVGESRLLNALVPLVTIVSRYAQFDSDFTSFHGIFRLLRLAAFSTKHPVQQVKFPSGADGTSAQGAQFVTVDAAAIPTVVRRFLHPARIVKHKVRIAATTKTKTKTKTKHKTKHKHHHAAAASTTLAPGLIADKAEMQNVSAGVLARREISFPLYIPAAIVSGTHLMTYTSPKIGNPYTYTLYDRNVDKQHKHGHPHSAYRFVIAANTLQGGYYGVEGTNWMNPPLIAHPSQTVERSGRKLMFFTNGGKLRYVAWRTTHGVYWVSNTLDYQLSNQQMVGIARSLTRFG